MEYRTLGKDLQVSEIGFGCMGLSHAYGKPVEKKEGVRLLREAVEMGYTFFDTAEVYGTPEDPHQNETLLGEALKGIRNREWWLPQNSASILIWRAGRSISR